MINHKIFLIIVLTRTLGYNHLKDNNNKKALLITRCLITH